eukprot:scaffold386_cov135-Amphora_coffeaeformis.AAC.3
MEGGGEGFRGRVAGVVAGGVEVGGSDGEGLTRRVVRWGQGREWEHGGGSGRESGQHVAAITLGFAVEGAE